MDNKFPKITFDIFEFSRKHECAVAVYPPRPPFEGCLKIGLFKDFHRWSLLIDLFSVIDPNVVLAHELEEAIKKLDEEIMEGKQYVYENLS